MTSEPGDYFEKFIRDATARIDACKHPAFMGVWPSKGEPRMICTKCYFSRPMTDQEQLERTRL